MSADRALLKIPLYLSMNGKWVPEVAKARADAAVQH
jgi:hypothetical protein